MKTTTFIMALLWLIPATAASGLIQDQGWPRQLTDDGNTLLIYQPQVDNWNNFTDLDWRMAVSLTPKGEAPAVGIVVLKGETQVDNDNQTVDITNLQIVETRFPSQEPARADRLGRMMKTFLPPTVSISLQRLIACVPKKQAEPGVQLKNDPPQIFVSEKPATLLEVDGQPVTDRIKDSKLEYVVNTQSPLFFDTQEKTYYLFAGQKWLSAPELNGQWSAATKLSEEMNRLPENAQWADLKEVIPLPANNAEGTIPVVFYSTKPAEVILFDGKPEYAQIPESKLQYATNTNSYLFYHSSTLLNYYLTSGRWFSAPNLGGPWTFATPDLPADFAKIPRDNPAAQVLASVPGTDEAEDAVLMAKIPTTVKVDPVAAAAAAKVTYDGTPKFAPIEQTSLSYATNSAQKVIRDGDLYYLCLQGIWFVSTTPQGPWQTASSVPQVIYTIPPSSPVYNVTYVTQVTNPGGVIYSSYTSGYTGVYVMRVPSGVVIAGGTGYYYRPYVAVYPGYRPPIYYPTPYTYGTVAHYHSLTGAYGVAQTAYGPYGSATRTASYNPYSGTYARTASASTAYGSAAVGRAYNPYTGASGATRQGSNAYSSWGSSVVARGGQSAYSQHYTTAQGTVARAESSTGGRAYGTSTKYGSTAIGKTGNDDLYAGHDGNVYKNTGSGWQKYDDGNWSSVDKPSTANTNRLTSQSEGQLRQIPSAGTMTKQPTGSGASRESFRPQAQESGMSRGSFQQQAQQRSESYARQGGNNQMQQLQQELRDRQRGEQSDRRFQQFQQLGSDRGWGGRGGGGRSFGGRR